MVLDIPAWLCNVPGSSEKTGIHSFNDAVVGTKYNHDYFMKHRVGVENGGTKFLNVIQGENHQDSANWYSIFKDYCDPMVYPTTHFDGWAFGGQNMCDISLSLKRIVDFHFDGLLEEGVHDVIHFLGMSKLEWAVVLTTVQRAARKYYNPNLLITFDAASPFLATANGRIYTTTNTKHDTKWTYRSEESIDDVAYTSDTRSYKDAVLNDGLYAEFDEGPVMSEVKINDICFYPPGSINKQGNVAKTSWDTFSYCIQMGHNVWNHINSVQKANTEYKNGSTPKMLIFDDNIKSVRIEDVVDSIFACKTREEAYAIIEDPSMERFWKQIVGSRGNIGKKIQNAKTQYHNIFDAEINTEKATQEEVKAVEDAKIALKERNKSNTSETYPTLFG
jgi:hypothetical protein